MAVQFDVHPRLRPQTPVEEAPPEAVVPVTPPPDEAPLPPPEPVAVADGAPETTPVETPSTPAPEDEFYRLPKKFSQRDIESFIEENPQFRQVVNTYVGRKVAKEYKPRLDAAELKTAELEAERQQAIRASIPPEQLRERLATDPNFRREYDTPIVNPANIRARNEFQAALDDATDSVADVASPVVIERLRGAIRAQEYDAEYQDGQRIPLTPQRAVTAFSRELTQYARVVDQLDFLKPNLSAEYHKAFSAGHYDIQRGPDQQPVYKDGQTVPMTQRQAVWQMTEDMKRMAVFVRTTGGNAAPAPAASAAPAQESQAAPAPVARQAPVANPKLAGAAPDLTAPSTSRGASRMTTSEYKRLNPVQKLKEFPEGLAAAEASGALVRDD